MSRRRVKNALAWSAVRPDCTETSSARADRKAARSPASVRDRESTRPIRTRGYRPFWVSRSMGGICAASARSPLARWRSMTPAGVRPSGRTLRSKRMTPPRASISAMASEMAGWVMASRLAAAAMPPVSQTARKISRDLRSKGRRPPGFEGFGLAPDLAIRIIYTTAPEPAPIYVSWPLEARPEEADPSDEIFDLLCPVRDPARASRLEAGLARARAQARIRRGHRRRRRPRPGDGLLPGQGAWPEERRGAGKGLARQRQCRAQHHHHPLQLPAAGQCALLRVVDEALGRAGAGLQLQRHGEPARRHQPVPFRSPARCVRQARQFHAPPWHRCRDARPRPAPTAGAHPGFRERALPDPGRHDSAPR